MKSPRNPGHHLPKFRGHDLFKGHHHPRRHRVLGVFFIRSGCLRVYLLSEKGKDITLYRLYAGDMCMLSASCVLQSITFDVMIDAEEDSECYVISGPAFVSVSEANPKIKIFSLETAISRFSDVMWVMQQILFMSMDQRLAIFLSDESKRLGSDTIPFTHEQIAKYMGSAREVVTRMLKYFASEGLVEVSRGGVKILDKNGCGSWRSRRGYGKPGGLRAGWFFLCTRNRAP